MSVRPLHTPVSAPANTRVQRGVEFLSVPGPTNIPERILNAMHRRALDFSGPEFIDISMRVFEDLKPVFKTKKGEVFIYSANGHGAWEAAMANILSPGDTVLVPETGNFSNAWAGMAEALHLNVKWIPGDWRHGIDADQVESMLRADTEKEIKAVLMVHTDTATGITSEVPPVRQAIDAAGHPALFVVDAIASLATVDLRMDEWGIDVVLAASQKGFMLPPGVAFVAASERALEAHQNSKMPGSYWRWSDRQSPFHYKRYCGTAPEHVIFGLQESLLMLEEETLEGAFDRHARLAHGVRLCIEKWSEAGALGFNAVVPEERANAVTTITLPDTVDTEEVRAMCRDQFRVAVGGGLGKLMGKVFRIGHMGDNNEAMILGTLGGVEAALKCLGIPVNDGVGTAIDWFVESAET